MNQVHFRLFVFGFCVYGGNVSTQDQLDIQAAYGVIGGFVPKLDGFVQIQFSASTTTTPATLQDVPTPQSPVNS